MSTVIACTAPPALPQARPSPTVRELWVRAVGPAGPVVGASVCAAAISAPEDRCAPTAANGYAQLLLPPATYVIRVTPPPGLRLDVTRQPVDLTGGDTSVSVPILGKATIAGTIRDDRGAIVTGAQVCAHATSDETTTCAKSIDGGRYSVGVRPGIYKLEVASPVGARLVTQWARGRVDSFEADSIDVRSRDADGIDVALQQGFVLQGTIRADRDGRPLEDAEVCSQTLAEPLPWDCERTDKRGAYRLLRPPGEYWLWFIPSDKDGETLVYQKYDRVETGVDATAYSLTADARLDVALVAGPRIVGKVTLEDGSPVSGAQVCVDTPFATGRICREAHVDGSYAVATREETYVIQVLPPRDSRAVATWWRHGRDWTDADAVVVVSGDTHVDVVMRKGIRLSGTVTTVDGTPVESAPVSVNDARGFVAGAYTDHRGRYELAVPRGDLTVDVFAPRISELQSLLGVPIRADVDMAYDATLPPAAP